ncbi:MAG: NADPH-dependent F420 reductase [Planctomycetota bacterium]|nr:NADPH-dependent F420 reductase [Planctomycetota bacterium]
MKIAFLGAGQVGGALAAALARAGHTVTIGARDAGSRSVRALLTRAPALSVAAPADAVRAADVVFLATPYNVAAEVVKELAGELAGKVLVDCTNPVGPGLTHGLRSERSGSEVVQAAAPRARVVKAFTIYGFENFEENPFRSAAVRPAMLFCGDDAAAKGSVAKLIEELGWEPVDVGGIAQALHLEHMTLLWIRMVRVGGHSPHTVWARLSGPQPK